MSALPQAVSDALWDAQSTSPCEEERRAFDALRSAIESALSAAEARATRAEGALRRSALSLAEEAERTADTAEEDGLKKGFRLPHLRNAAAKVRAALSPSLDAPCPHPARGGHHEVYADGSGFLCRACGARALAGEAQKEGTNG
jgi:hypothetical protein